MHAAYLDSLMIAGLFKEIGEIEQSMGDRIQCAR